MGHEFGLFISVDLGQLENSSVFADMFQRQLETLQKIEEVDGTDERVHAQVFFIFLPLHPRQR
jgi:hypothetical protein